MKNEESAATSDLLQQLQAASAGLYYMSETDAPFEVVHLPHVQDSSGLPEALVQQAGMPEEASTEEVDLQYFFRNMTSAAPEGEEEGNDSARRFRELQELMEQRLQDVKVYRLGKRQIQAYILGKTASGDYAGLKTMLVET